MSERRRLLMAQGEEDNPWEKIDYLTIIKSDPSESSIGIDIYPAQIAFEYEYEEDGEVYYEYDYIWADMEYSKDDGQTWHRINFKPNYEEWEQINHHFYLYGNETIKLRANGASFYNIYSYFIDECYDYMSFRINTGSGKVNLAGTPNSLLWPEIDNLKNDLTYDSCFYGLFYTCSGIQNILNPKTFLPSANLFRNCYKFMFESCQNLKNAPELPATTLADHCYDGMFYRCTSLVNAPELPATTLADYCYSYMFYSCTSLVDAPALPATILEDYCYQGMFSGCTSLVDAPALPATILDIGCYYYMFSMCKSLINAPILPAIILAEGCYIYMFNGCNQLNYIKALFTTNLGSSNIYTTNWVYAVASKGTFVKNKDATWNVTGANGIPSGWTVITE